MPGPQPTRTRPPRGGSPRIERAYLGTLRIFKRLRQMVVPYARRVLRFLALPYCYFALIDWDECTASRMRVVGDLLYIFFRLKYFPDNYSVCRLWTVDRQAWHLYYGSMYEPYQRRQLQREVQPPEYQVVFADKEIWQHLCISLGLPTPRLIGCVDPGDDYLRAIREGLEKCAGRQLIAKPVRGAGGIGVLVVEEQDGETLVLVAGERVPLAGVKITQRMILQERVQQHDGMAAIYPFALNTIRIQTLLTRDREVVVTAALARFGRNMSRVDNLCSGGIGVGVDITKGQLMRVGRDYVGREYERHPESGVRFEGYAIPRWSEAVALVKAAQTQFSYFRLLGFDVAITPVGPIIVETNPGGDNAVTEGVYGPILANPVTVLEFDRYGLLINRPTKALAARLRREAGESRVK